MVPAVTRFSNEDLPVSILAVFRIGRGRVETQQIVRFIPHELIVAS